MSKPFDATLKDLGRDAPADALTTFDQPPTVPLSLLNVDLSTVTTAADLVIGIGTPLTEIIHLDFQASAAAWKHADTLVYNSLLYRHYRVPVHSIVVLLWPKAAHSNLNGVVAYSARPGRGRMDFGYEVVSLWTWPTARLLAGGLGMTPLAILGALPEGVPVEDGLRHVTERMMERLNREASPERCRKLLTSAFILCGLRVKPRVALDIFRGVGAMQESDTYLYIVDEGQEKKTKELILRFGRTRLGPPDETILTRLNAITEDLDRLDRMINRLVDGPPTTWQDLLDTP